MELPKAPVKRLMKNSGVERVSDDAVEQVREKLEELAEEISKDSAEAANHAGRKTVKREDIKLVA